MDKSNFRLVVRKDLIYFLSAMIESNDCSIVFALNPKLQWDYSEYQVKLCNSPDYIFNRLSLNTPLSESKKTQNSCKYLQLSQMLVM